MAKGIPRPNEKEIASQVNQMQVQQAAMNDIAALEEQTRVLQQESLNKSHDPELSQFTGATSNGPIGTAEVRKAYETFEKYKEKKKPLEQKLEMYEQYWQLKHWDYINQHNPESKRIKPKSAWLVNTILNKHADAMDNYPEPNVLPRAKDDEEVAKILSKVIPVILEQNEYQKTYSSCMWDKNKFGTSVTGVFWNNDKNNGLGDIDIKCTDIASLFWKPGINNIQDSPNVFYVSYMDKEELKARYPDLDITSGVTEDTFHYINYGKDVDDTDMVAVFDWYYKRRIKTVDDKGIQGFKTVVHYVKFCNEQVLYATENDPNYAETGWLAHGQYPFIFDVLFPIKADVCGMGYIDLIADDQIFIDVMQRNILENANWNARSRSIVNTSAGLNEEEYTDTENAVIHCDGHLDEGTFKPVPVQPLAPIYENVLLEKIQEMKDTSGNTAASQGQNSNVTTASGIASLQEAAGKLSRDASQESYSAFKQVCYQIIELIRQFYTESRCFRIIGENGNPEYVDFDNRDLKPQDQGAIPLMNGMVLDLGKREPVLDIEVKPQKKSAYSKEAQNQTAINLYQMGMFAPGNGDSALACLEMMDFDGLEKIKEYVRNNAVLFKQVQVLSEALIAAAPDVAAQLGVIPPAMEAATNNQPTGRATTGNNESRGSLSAQAANATRESTTVRS